MAGMNNFRIPLSVDVVLLTLLDGVLQVAVMRRGQAPDEPFPGRDALPGGTVDTDGDRDTDVTVRRVLLQKTGMQPPYFEQLRLFSGRDRDPRGWSAALAHVALVPSELLCPEGALRWVPVSEAHGLAFDHDAMVEEAVARVRNKASYSTLPFYLMPAEFTLPELQSVYETLLGCPIEDRRTFRRQVEGLGVLEALPKQRQGGKGRPSQLYQMRRRAELVLLPGHLRP